MYDWLLGEAVAAWPHDRQLRRDWCGMWLRVLNWLAVPSVDPMASLDPGPLVRV